MRKRAGGSRISRAFIAFIAAALAIGVLGVGSAWADYEQAPEHFGVSGESAQLSGALAMAVNAAGAGGVEAGSLYVGGENNRVLRYTPGSEGKEPEFREAWGWGIAEGGPPNEFVKCGPAYAEIPAGLRPPHTFAKCLPSSQRGEGGEEVGRFNMVAGLAVDQATGNVYVLNNATPLREHHLIEIFTPTGTPIGEGFGDRGRFAPFPSESIAEGPEKLHEQASREQDGFTVDGAGTVYVTDRDFSEAPGTHQARVMSFKPEHAGDFEHYVYTGRAADIETSFLTYFHRLGLAGTNRLVTASQQQIREYSTEGGQSPICSFEVSSGTIDGMTTNSQTGEVFYFRSSGLKGKVAGLGPCNPATHEFAELQEAIPPTPAAEHIYAFAVNPGLEWSPSRPPGVLYGADPQVGTSAEEKGIGDIFVPAVPQPPAIESESVVNTGSTSSTLQAQINLRRVKALFHFEYMTESEYLANHESFEGPGVVVGTAPLSPGTLGGSAAGTATAAISNLAPGTSYVFRVIVQREGCPGEPTCETKGPTATFSTYPAAEPGLPDGRAYELVSPAQKHGGEVFPADWKIGSCLGECKPPGAQSFSVFPMQSTAGGNAVTFMGYPFSPTEGAAVFNSYLSRRSAAGWQTIAMSPPLQENRTQLSYSEPLDQGVITTQGPAPLGPGGPSGYPNLYLQSALNPAAPEPLLTDGIFEALSATGRPYRGANRLSLRYAGHSPDFAAQYFAANDSLTFAGAYAPQPPDPGPNGFDLYEWKSGQLALVNVLPGNASVATGASFASASPETNGIAAGGRRVFWQAGGHLYMREDGRTTREIHYPGTFVTASSDGLEVLLSDGCLYSLTTITCVDLTQGSGGFLGIAGQSTSLSRIYFVDTAKLPGKNERQEEGVAGKPNLYLYEAGVGTRFIATLTASDGAGGGDALADWAVSPGFRTAEASPDGRYLAFGSVAPLTGYGNTGPCAADTQHTEFIPALCKEIFLYDSATGRLTCPSCNPTGEPPLGNSTLRRIREAPEWLPQPRYLTDQGRLLFDSSDRLSPRDTDGRVEDVYEAEPAGVGSCSRPAGCISLISPGTGLVDSNFLAMDESGANVFFTSRDRLVPADTDELIDVYDARVGGGFPGEGEGGASECRGEACQTAPNSPTAPNSSTSNFQGSGNVTPEKTHKKAHKCPKGKVKKKGKCVKKQAKKPKKKARTAGKKHGGAK